MKLRTESMFPLSYILFSYIRTCCHWHLGAKDPSENTLLGVHVWAGFLSRFPVRACELKNPWKTFTSVKGRGKTLSEP